MIRNKIVGSIRRKKLIKICGIRNKENSEIDLYFMLEASLIWTLKIKQTLINVIRQDNHLY